MKMNLKMSDQQWKSAKETPDDCRNVYIANYGDQVPHVGWYNRNIGQWMRVSAEVTPPDVWMELPKPPPKPETSNAKAP